MGVCAGLGALRKRDAVLTAPSDLPLVQIATDAEALRFIARHGLAGSGVGYVDVHLRAIAAKLGLASALQPRPC